MDLWWHGSLSLSLPLISSSPLRLLYSIVFSLLSSLCPSFIYFDSRQQRSLSSLSEARHRVRRSALSLSFAIEDPSSSFALCSASDPQQNVLSICLLSFLIDHSSPLTLSLSFFSSCLFLICCCPSSLLRCIFGGLSDEEGKEVSDEGFLIDSEGKFFPLKCVGDRPPPRHSIPPPLLLSLSPC